MDWNIERFSGWMNKWIRKWMNEWMNELDFCGEFFLSFLGFF